MSLYLPELDAVFIHVPKAAGTWVATVMDASGIKCEPAKGVGTHNLPSAYSDRGRRFMFVRNPMTWYESAWRGLHSSWPQKQEVRPLQRERSWSPIRYLTYLAGEADFESFIQTILDEQPGFCSRMFEWYAGPPGAPQVDFVGRAEHAREDLSTILKWLGWSGELADVPKANEGTGDRPSWSVAQRGEIEIREFAIDRWYESEGPFRVEP